MKEWVVFVWLSLAYATVRVFSPREMFALYSNAEIKNSYANYGKIPYGTYLGGRVYFFPDNKNGCNRFDGKSLDREGDPDSEFSPIVLVERGGCSFVRKTRNVQELGGALTLIADNRAGINPEQVIMVDDGTGGSIAIPTILVSKEFGDTLKVYIKKTEDSILPYNLKEFTVLVVDFLIDKPDDRVEYDIWYSSGDDRIFSFLSRMKQYNDRLGRNALMTPRFQVINCTYCSDEDKSKNCIVTSDAVYCPPASRIRTMTGREVLKLGIKESCVYSAYFEENNAEKWWRFMAALSSCRRDFSDECVDRAIVSAGVDKKRLTQCLKKEATILRDTYEMFMSSGISYNPAIVVNRHVYRGALDAENVFRTICSGFNVTPDVCSTDYDPATGKVKAQANSDSIFTLRNVLIFLLLIVTINVLLVYCYRRYIRREMKDEMQLQISSMMSQYKAINDSKEQQTFNP